MLGNMMKTRLLVLFVFVGFLFSFALMPNSEASREVLTVDEMSKRSDAIAVGTVESIWIDIRLFDDYSIVDTAKIKVDDWLKNNKNSDTLEIRYYGYWAKTIDGLRGKYIFDNPVFDYKSGQKVLLILDHEEDTAVMGGGYYPIFEGSYIITKDVAVSQSGERTSLQELQNTINSNLDSKPDLVQTDTKDDAVPTESGVRLCAYIGFEKYPENLFAEFLQNPYNQDVTFLNFTDNDLKQIPEFYELMLQSNQIKYTLNDRVRFAVTPSQLVMNLTDGNAVTFVNDGLTSVNIFDHSKGMWRFDNVRPSSQRTLIINETGFYEFLIQNSLLGQQGRIAALSDDTNSLPVGIRAKMAQTVIGSHFGENDGLISVGAGGLNPGITIGIDEKFQDKHDDAERFYYEKYSNMIPFDVPITIEFSKPIELQ
jgi:hypothetical protein